MNCESVRAWMRERFDQGLPLEAGFEAHLAECPVCRAYAGRLRGLEDALYRLEAEAPSPALAARICRRVSEARRSGLPEVLAGLVIVLVSVLTAGWWMPLDISKDGWLDALSFWIPTWRDLQGLAGLPTGVLHSVQSYVQTAIPRAGGHSGWVSGGSIAFLVLCLLGFNALLPWLGAGRHSQRPGRAD